MSFLFGGAPPSTDELARRYRQQIDRAVREIDREAAKLQRDDKTLMVEIRRCASTNPQMAAQKAQSVVRVRRMLSRFSNMRSHMQDVSSRISNVKSTEALRRALGSAVRTMQGFNANNGSKALHMQLKEFSKQNTMMGINNEMTDDQLDEAFDDELDEEEVSNVVLDVITEAGVTLPAAYMQSLRVAPEPPGDIEERLKRLCVPRQQAF